METKKPIKKELRKMKVGQTNIYWMDNPKIAHIASVTCNQLKNEEGIAFQVNTDYKNNAVCIKRIS